VTARQRTHRAVRASVIVAVSAPLLCGLAGQVPRSRGLANFISARLDKLGRAQARSAEVLHRWGLATPPRRLRIVIRKAERVLVLQGDGRELFRCPVGLGGAPVGPKRRQGDGRTPEGDYRICSRNAASRFHLFLGLDYPTAADADRGYAERSITAAERDAIKRAREPGGCPPWNTLLGGTVGIHGNGSSWDWTLGCIALNDDDIETLWGLCPVGTAVRIEP